MVLDSLSQQSFNDSLGHTAGDHLPAAIAERLAASVHPYDVIARF